MDIVLIKKDCSITSAMTSALQARFTALRVQASDACLVEPLGVLIPPYQTKRPPLGDLFIWWSRGESNPRPQALYRQFYILSCVVKFNLRPRQRANIAQASYLGFRDMLSNPTFHISRVYDAALACAIHPTGEMVQRPAGLSG